MIGKDTIDTSYLKDQEWLKKFNMRDALTTVKKCQNTSEILYSDARCNHNFSYN